MKITIFSDYVCPFCYVGKAALFQALEGFEYEVEFHPYQLRRPPVAKVDPMHDEARLKRFHEVIHPMAEACGIEMKLPFISPHPYTTLAFQGYYFACDYKKGLEYNDAVFHAFYVDEKDIGEIDVLCDILMQLGLEPSLFKQAIKTQQYMPILDDQVRIREEMQIKGVPTFMINDKKIVGAHSVDDFRKAIYDEISEEMAGMACGPEGCKTE